MVVSATVTGSIDLWLFSGSVSVTATITVEGPQFHGTASVNLGPTSVTVEFGDPAQEAWRLLGWLEFVQKYLELGAGGAARALAASRAAAASPARSPAARRRRRRTAPARTRSWWSPSSS